MIKPRMHVKYITPEEAQTNFMGLNRIGRFIIEEIILKERQLKDVAKDFDDYSRNKNLNQLHSSLWRALGKLGFHSPYWNLKEVRQCKNEVRTLLDYTCFCVDAQHFQSVVRDIHADLQRKNSR